MGGTLAEPRPSRPIIAGLGGMQGSDIPESNGLATTGLAQNNTAHHFAEFCFYSEHQLLIISSIILLGFVFSFCRQL